MRNFSKTFLPLLAFICLFQNNALAFSEKVVAEKGNMKVILRLAIEDEIYSELILIRNGKEFNVTKFYGSDVPDIFLSDTFLLYNGGTGIGLYIYDTVRDRHYLLETGSAGGEWVIFYFDFKQYEDQFYVHVGHDGSGFSDFCLYDLKKMNDFIRKHDLSRYAAYSDWPDGTKDPEGDLTGLFEKRKMAFCSSSFPLMGSLTDFKWLGKNKIGFSHIYPPYREEIKDVYESNLDGRDLKKTKVILRGKEFIPFKDVDYTDDGGHSFYEVIYIAEAQGWLTGYPDGTVRLGNKISRAEFIQMAVKAFGKTGESPLPQGHPFTDVPGDAWYAPSVYAALKAGALTGYPDSAMRPAQAVNRAEALKILLLVAGKNPTDTSYQYADTAPDQWYSAYASFSYNHSLMPYDGGKLYPEREMTRGEAVGLITRVLELG